MTHPTLHSASSSWTIQAWVSFAVSASLMAVGIYNLPVDLWTRGYLFMGLVFTISSCFSLAKMVRDKHEASKIHNKVEDVRTERILREVSHEMAV